ncbi:MAG: hypothetical protein HUN04_18935 [Desulfobacter sp.]|nr:MAG: hypothetical protein HUN04_18935 [Desulfobacter sp.]
MRKLSAVLLFILFALLCGAEMLPKFMASAQREKGAVLHVRSAEQPRRAGGQLAAEKKDYRKLVKDINVNGA